MLIVYIKLLILDVVEFVDVVGAISFNVIVVRVGEVVDHAVVVAESFDKCIALLFVAVNTFLHVHLDLHVTDVTPIGLISEVPENVVELVADDYVVVV